MKTAGSVLFFRVCICVYLFVCFLSDKCFCLKLDWTRNLVSGIHNRVAHVGPFKLSCSVLSRVSQKSGQQERVWRKTTGKVKLVRALLIKLPGTALCPTNV